MTQEIRPTLEFSIAGIAGLSPQITVSLVSILLIEFVVDCLAKHTSGAMRIFFNNVLDCNFFCNDI